MAEKIYFVVYTIHKIGSVEIRYEAFWNVDQAVDIARRKCGHVFCYTLSNSVPLPHK